MPSVFNVTAVGIHAHHRLCTQRSLARSRDMLGILSVQLEAARMQDTGKGVTRIRQIAKCYSALPYVPFFGAFSSLGTGRLMLYTIFAFDVLHKRFVS